MQSNNSIQNAKVVGGIVITAVTLIAVYFLILENKPPAPVSASESSSAIVATPESKPTETAGTTSEVTTPASSTTGSSQPTTSTKYKDGQYTSTVSYDVPKHSNTISITVTLSSDSITSVTAKNSYSDRESREYIDDFMAKLSSAIVSKKLDNAQLSRLAGASSTTDAYNDAITKIASQAKT